MKRYINLRCLSDRSLALLSVLFIAVLLGSCKEDKLNEIIIPRYASFESDSYTISRSSSEELLVVLNFTKPLEDKGTVTIAIDHNTTADNLGYIITPEPVNGKVTLNLEKGVATASFSVKSTHFFDDDKVIGFKIESATGSALVSKTNINTVVTLEGNVLVPELNASVSSLENFGELKKGEESDVQSYTVTAANLTENLAVTAPDNFKVSLDNVTFHSSATIDFKSINTAPVTVYVKFTPNIGEDKTITGNITHLSGASSVEVSVTGKETGNTPPEVMLLTEYFNYGTTAGDLIAKSSNKWVRISGSTTPLQYVVPGLSFTGYAGSGQGGAVVSTNGSGSREDATLALAEQNSGVIYAAQLISISNAEVGTGDFFYSFRDGSGTFNRIYASKDTDGKLVLSLGRNTSPTASATAYNFNTTYLVVTKYDFTSKISSMFVISGTIPSTEPAIPDVITSGGTAPTKFTEVSIRQNTGVLDATIDGIRVGVTWKGVLGL